MALNVGTTLGGVLYAPAGQTGPLYGPDVSLIDVLLIGGGVVLALVLGPIGLILGLLLIGVAVVDLFNVGSNGGSVFEKWYSSG